MFSRSRLVAGAAMLLTSLLIGCLCQGLWGFFLLGVGWTLFTLLCAAAVRSAVELFVPQPFE